MHGLRRHRRRQIQGAIQAFARLLAFVPLAGLAACAEGGKMNHVIAPANYSGALVLVQVAGSGPGHEKTDDRYVWRFPATGVLCADNFDPFHPTFVLTAEYEDGRPIYTEFADQPPPPSAAAIRIVPIGQRSTSRQDADQAEPANTPLELWFAVGPAPVIDEVRNRWQAFEGSVLPSGATTCEGALIDSDA